MNYNFSVTYVQKLQDGVSSEYNLKGSLPSTTNFFDAPTEIYNQIKVYEMKRRDIPSSQFSLNDYIIKGLTISH